jgi:uncharacterized membrane protein YphA (DoxX/SURF4 family)
MSLTGRSETLTAARVPAFDLTGLLLRLGAGVLFIGLGLTKFESDSYWVRLFIEIGFGESFRYVTGAIQVVGGLLLLTPRTVYAGALIAGGTMVGAAMIHIFVLDTGFGGAVFPLAILGGVVVVAFHRPD